MNSASHTTGSSLTNVNRIGRHAVKWSVVALIVLIISPMLISAGIAYWKATHPQPPPPPTVGFGVLPAPEFPTQLAEQKPSSYVLETANGRLPNFPDRAKVYFLPKAIPSLLADQSAKETAAKYGFMFEPEIVDETTYRWTQSTASLISTFELDVNELHFKYTTDFLSRPELIVNRDLPTNYDAVTAVKGFLSLGGVLPADVATASGQVRFMKTVGGNLVEAVSLSDADYLAVDINRTPIDGKYEMYTAQGKTGTITAIISGQGSGRSNIMQMVFAHYEPDYTQVHTYPLRSVSDAWRVLQAGEGYIPNASTAPVTVRSVVLGYYDPTDEYHPYLEPIYIFTGDNDFLGYVPAIDPAYLE